jgi:hypothetical protein
MAKSFLGRRHFWPSCKAPTPYLIFSPMFFVHKHSERPGKDKESWPSAKNVSKFSCESGKWRDWNRCFSDDSAIYLVGQFLRFYSTFLFLIIIGRIKICVTLKNKWKNRTSLFFCFSQYVTTILLLVFTMLHKKSLWSIYFNEKKNKLKTFLA